MRRSRHLADRDPGRDTPGAQVVPHRLGERDDGTSSRRRIHLTWNDAGAEAGNPASVFCKSTMNLDTRWVFGLNGGIAGETTFYRQIRPTLPVEAPHALLSRYDPGSFNSLRLGDLLPNHHRRDRGRPLL